ncbi:MAG TPA: hypothetical protein VKS43_12165 [Burkholderiales bacterium]|nr:hypothetical protein [Burkholderiales bacterium]
MIELNPLMHLEVTLEPHGPKEVIERLARRAAGVELDFFEVK